MKRVEMYLIEEEENLFACRVLFPWAESLNALRFKVHSSLFPFISLGENPLNPCVFSDE